MDEDKKRALEEAIGALENSKPYSFEKDVPPSAWEGLWTKLREDIQICTTEIDGIRLWRGRHSDDASDCDCNQHCELSAPGLSHQEPSRFTIRGERTLFACVDPATAVMEAWSTEKDDELYLAEAQMEATLDVLDLRVETTIQTPVLNLFTWCQEFERGHFVPPAPQIRINYRTSQVIAHIARAHGVDLILYPSVKNPGSLNIAGYGRVIEDFEAHPTCPPDLWRDVLT